MGYVKFFCLSLSYQSLAAHWLHTDSPNLILSLLAADLLFIITIQQSAIPVPLHLGHLNILFFILSERKPIHL